jgi:serine phosphatase RsbU (regulator of sigma subunit)
MAGVEPAEVMARLEQVLERDRPDDAEFATVCCAWLDPRDSRLRVVLGGHHRPLLLDGGAREIDIPYGPALGMFSGERWQAAAVELPEDCASTDGLVEAALRQAR